MRLASSWDSQRLESFQAVRIIKNQSTKLLIRDVGFYLISFWYKREEAQQRFTIYWCSVLIASAFGGPRKRGTGYWRGREETKKHSDELA